MRNLLEYEFDVPPESIDANGHVNNVEYVRWMQDAGVRHHEVVGGPPLLAALAATWVARETTVRYLRPAMPGDRVRVRTWVAQSRRVLSTRHYEIRRAVDGVPLATGHTDWVLIDVATGRPKSIPPEIVALFADGDAEPGQS
ncbi:MAG TPA: thioesterase family protein [Tepidisphaeraceae bacterium]|nr:thioesterase family protein [Tepidisphaeraceae bacterium]